MDPIDFAREGFYLFDIMTYKENIILFFQFIFLPNDSYGFVFIYSKT